MFEIVEGLPDTVRLVEIPRTHRYRVLFEGTEVGQITEAAGGECFYHTLGNWATGNKAETVEADSKIDAIKRVLNAVGVSS